MYLITGSKGQLGTELTKLLPDALQTDAAELDITDLDAVCSYVADNNVTTIINCAAYTAVDKAEDEPEQAHLINAVGPENLAKSGAKIIHVSTDYVFDGSGHRPYTEADETNPVSVYGRTKRAGEEAVLEHATAAAVIRTSWLYSPYGNNFLKTMLRLGAEKESVRVVSDQVGTPTYAADLAAAIVRILPQVSVGKTGIYHFSNAGVCSWYDFAQEIMDIAGLPCSVYPILSAEYPTKAERPFYSVLDKRKIEQVFGVDVPHWKNALRRCWVQMD